MNRPQRLALLAGGTLAALTVIVLLARVLGPGETGFPGPLMLAAGTAQAAAAARQTAEEPPAGVVDPVDSAPLDLDELTPAFVNRVLGPNQRTFEEMVEVRAIRMLVTYNRTNFFLDGGRARGILAEAGELFQKHLNEQLGLSEPKLDVILIPVARDQLIPFLIEGRGDIAAANLTITPQREAQVVFSRPSYTGVKELIVAGPGSSPLSAINDLAGQPVHVRRSSSYFESLTRLNEQFREQDLQPVDIRLVSEELETEDLLEMVNAGLLPYTVADSYLANLWRQVFESLVIYEDFALATGQSLAWAIRPTATGTKKWVDEFIQASRKGTLTGNILINRYYKSTKFIDSATQGEDRRRFEELVGLFERYGDEYGFDHLMIAAQGYQESRLDQSARSSAGAVGVMQIKPSTAADPAVGIPDIEGVENNIHAGIRYLKHVGDRYFDDPAIDEMNRTLFCFAAYNMGPTRMSRLRRKAAELGIDNTRWFGQMEQLVADEVGREPVRYVRNIFKYYTAYSLLAAQDRS